MHVFSDDEVEIYKTLKIKNKERKLENILKKFETFFVQKFNVTYKRRKFLTCVQKSSESTENYVPVIHKLSASCD